MEQVLVKGLIRLVIWGTITIKSEPSGRGCDHRHVSAIKGQRADLPNFYKTIGKTLFTPWLLRQHSVGLMAHMRTGLCQLASRWPSQALPPMRDGVDRVNLQLSVSSHELQAITVELGKDGPSECPMETPSQEEAYEFQVRQINTYMFVVQSTRSSHASRRFVIG